MSVYRLSRPTVYNWLGELEQRLVSDRELSTGNTVVGVRYTIDGRDDKLSPTGIATLFVGDEQVAEQRAKTQPGYFSLSGEGSCAGRDIGQPVTSDYTPPFSFRGGTIIELVVEIGDESCGQIERELAAAFARD